MTTIAFIGLGIMGGPMAANLVRAGRDVVGYNLTNSRCSASWMPVVEVRAACPRPSVGPTW